MKIITTVNITIVTIYSQQLHAKPLLRCFTNILHVFTVLLLRVRDCSWQWGYTGEQKGERGPLSWSSHSSGGAAISNHNK